MKTIRKSRYVRCQSLHLFSNPIEVIKWKLKNIKKPSISYIKTKFSKMKKFILFSNKNTMSSKVSIIPKIFYLLY